MTRTKQRTFWGTWANALCFVANASSYDGNYCEGGGKDYRPPSAYMYSDTDLSTINIVKGQLSGTNLARLTDTLGLRAAGSRNGVVLFAGPSKSIASVYIFAFDEDGKFLSSCEHPGFDDVRKFTQDLAFDMYVGLSRSDGCGEIWRFIGSQSQPLLFEKIADVPGDPAEVSFYQERLLLGTWPAGGKMIQNSSTPKVAALLLSSSTVKDLRGCALNCTSPWITVWSTDDYEPDAVTALSVGVSVHVESNGWVYWGTMQMPYGGAALFERTYGPAISRTEKLLRVMGTHRPTAIFRARDLVPAENTTPVVELLYGEQSLPIYDQGTDKWRLQANLMQQIPRFGESGFGNFFNVYTWSMTTIRGLVLIGTFDNSYGHFHQKNDATFLSLAAKSGDSITLDIMNEFERVVASIEDSNLSGNTTSVKPRFGADLYAIPTQGASNGDIGPAEWVSLSGLGNELNYGLRNLLPHPSNQKDSVFVGTANSYNLEAKGGWEVYELQGPLTGTQEM